MKARVLHFVPHLGCAATTRQWLCVCERLVAVGYPVRVVSVGGDGVMEASARATGAEVASIGWERGRPDRWFSGLDQQLTDFRPDVVQTWAGVTHLWGRLAAMRRRVPRLIANYRTVSRRQANVPRWLDRRLVRHTHAFISNGAAADQFCAELGASSDRRTLIRDGVPPIEPATASERREFRARWGLAETTRIVVYVGSLEAEQRVKDLLWAIDLLHAIDEDTHLVVIGDGPHRWRLERFARQVHADQRTHFMGWNENAPRCVAASDCLWLATGRVGSPHSVLEAMSAGVPVVAVDTPSIREVVTHEVNGLLVPLGDRGALARATHRVFSRWEEARERADAAKRHVASEFSIAKLQQQYEDLYQKVLYM